MYHFHRDLGKAAGGDLPGKSTENFILNEPGAMCSSISVARLSLTQ